MGERYLFLTLTVTNSPLQTIKKQEEMLFVRGTFQ